jgi:predicted DNA-binding protein (MmcQ/YjbR family)
MNINRNKLDKAREDEEIEVINVKLKADKIATLLLKPGFYPAYHMNKKNWITISLDNTLKDEEIMNYIIESHQYTEHSDK